MNKFNWIFFLSVVDSTLKTEPNSVKMETIETQFSIHFSLGDDFMFTISRYFFLLFTESEKLWMQLNQTEWDADEDLNRSM